MPLPQRRFLSGRLRLFPVRGDKIPPPFTSGTINSPPICKGKQRWSPRNISRVSGSGLEAYFTHKGHSHEMSSCFCQWVRWHRHVRAIHVIINASPDQLGPASWTLQKGIFLISPQNSAKTCTLNKTRYSYPVAATTKGHNPSH